MARLAIPLKLILPYIFPLILGHLDASPVVPDIAAVALDHVLVAASSARADALDVGVLALGL